MRIRYDSDGGKQRVMARSICGTKGQFQDYLKEKQKQAAMLRKRTEMLKKAAARKSTMGMSFEGGLYTPKSKQSSFLQGIFSQDAARQSSVSRLAKQQSSGLGGFAKLVRQVTQNFDLEKVDDTSDSGVRSSSISSIEEETMSKSELLVADSGITRK